MGALATRDPGGGVEYLPSPPRVSARVRVPSTRRHLTLQLARLSGEESAGRLGFGGDLPTRAQSGCKCGGGGTHGRRGRLGVVYANWNSKDVQSPGCFAALWRPRAVFLYPLPWPAGWSSGKRLPPPRRNRSLHAGETPPGVRCYAAGRASVPYRRLHEHVRPTWLRSGVLVCTRVQRDAADSKQCPSNVVARR